MTKKYKYSNEAIKVHTNISGFEVEEVMNIYGISDIEACLFIMQNKKEVADLDLIYNKRMTEFKAFEYMPYIYRVIIHYI